MTITNEAMQSNLTRLDREVTRLSRYNSGRDVVGFVEFRSDLNRIIDYVADAKRFFDKGDVLQAHEFVRAAEHIAWAMNHKHQTFMWKVFHAADAA